jgi:hypothetical protein
MQDFLMQGKWRMEEKKFLVLLQVAAEQAGYVKVSSADLSC